MMSNPRFFIPKGAIRTELAEIHYENESVVRQLRKVLRVKLGESVDFLDGSGSLYRSRLTACEGKSVVATIDEVVSVTTSGPETVVALSTLKSDRFEWAVEKLTELNVNEVIPTLLTRTVVRAEPGDSPSKLDGTTHATNKLTRWRSIAREAAEQCERATIPTLVAPMSFADFLSHEQKHRPSGIKIICSEREDAPSIEATLCNVSGWCGDGRSVTIAVGAEGGFTPEEIQQAHDCGFRSVSLGKLILRAETAAIYALAIVASRINSNQ